VLSAKFFARVDVPHHDGHDFYSRVASRELRNDVGRKLSAQLKLASIISVDSGHDRFLFSEGLPEPDHRLPEDAIVELSYRDDDGVRVNVLLHFVDGALSWAERYRDTADTILRWPPPKERAVTVVAW